jgi:hypothetical protein
MGSVSSQPTIRKLLDKCPKNICYLNYEIMIAAAAGTRILTHVNDQNVVKCSRECLKLRTEFKLYGNMWNEPPVSTDQVS